MDWWQSLILGIVEGLTEYLPVSSTAHLILVQKLLDVPDSPGVKAFEIVIQFGAILAVVGVYARHVKQLFQGLFGQSVEGQKLLLRLLAAFIPAAVIGLIFEKRIDKTSLWVISTAWIVGGFAILVVEFWRKRRGSERGGEIEQLSIQAALAIGLMQAMSLCPGVSRSLVTLLGGLLVGLRFSAALEFSFLLGGLTLTAASGYKAVTNYQAIVHDISPLAIAVGMLASTVAAFATVKWMIRSLERFGLTPFGYYRIILGVFIFTLLATHRL